MNNKNKKLKKDNKFLPEPMTWEMRTEMMLKISTKWSCTLKLSPSETNNSNKKLWSEAIMLKKKSKKILWLKLTDWNLSKVLKKNSDSTKLNKDKIMIWLSNKLKKESFKESELKKKLKKKDNSWSEHSNKCKLKKLTPPLTRKLKLNTNLMLSIMPTKELFLSSKKELLKSKKKNKRSLNITLKNPEKKQKLKLKWKD